MTRMGERVRKLSANGFSFTHKRGKKEVLSVSQVKHTQSGRGKEETDAHALEGRGENQLSGGFVLPKKKKKARKLRMSERRKVKTSRQLGLF